MTNWKEKYPIGSQWKTRGGWRAVVVDWDESTPKWPLKVYHVIEGRRGEAIWHTDSGLGEIRDAPEYNLDQPWKEPRTGELWVNVYEAERGLSFGYGYGNREMCDSSDDARHMKRIACVHVKWVEGEGMEDSE